MPGVLCCSLICAGEGPKRGMSVNSHSATLNTFLQTGQLVGVAALLLSLALLGSSHPSTALAILETTTGVQVAATHERILFFSVFDFDLKEALAPASAAFVLRSFKSTSCYASSSASLESCWPASMFEAFLFFSFTFCSCFDKASPQVLTLTRQALTNISWN